MNENKWLSIEIWLRRSWQHFITLITFQNVKNDYKNDYITRPTCTFYLSTTRLRLWNLSCEYWPCQDMVINQEKNVFRPSPFKSLGPIWVNLCITFSRIFSLRRTLWKLEVIYTVLSIFFPLYSIIIQSCKVIRVSFFLQFQIQITILERKKSFKFYIGCIFL